MRGIMRRNYRIILASSILLLLAALWWLPKLEEEENITDMAGLASLRVETEKGESLTLWRLSSKEEEENAYSLFLPSYAASSGVRWKMGADRRLLLEGEWVRDGGRLIGTEAGRVYSVALYDSESRLLEEGKLTVYQSRSLPTIHLATRSGSMDLVHADQENSEAGYMRVLSEEGTELYAGKFDRLKGRGNTSWDAAKKSYLLELESRAGLLGMDAAKKWVLSANYYDGAYVRNAVGYDLARAAGLSFTPDSRFADLYIDGIYYGLYQLTERVEAGTGRVEIGNGYLLELDYPERAVQEDSVLYLDNAQPVVVHHPGKVTEEGAAFLQDWFSRMQEALYAADYWNAEDEKGIFSYLDQESFAAMYLMEEVLMDLDMGVTSCYLYMEEGEKDLMHSGPVWDLDNTMGRGGYERRDILFANDLNPSTNQMSRWYARLCGNEEFRRQVYLTWQNRLYPALCGAAEEIDGWMALLEPSIRMDQARWPGPRSVFMPDASLEENVDYLKDYLRERTDFLQGCFTGGREETERSMKQRAAGLPELETVESQEVQEEEEEEAPSAPTGLMSMAAQNHGAILAGMALLFLVVLLWLDSQRNAHGVRSTGTHAGRK